MVLPREDRVCVHVISTGGFYGAERAVVEISAYMADHGWTPHIIALEGRGASTLVERAQEKGISSQLFGTSRVGFLEMRRRLAAILDDLPSGVIHSHGYKPDILLALPPFREQWIRISTCHTWYSENWRMRLWEALDKRVLRDFDCVVPVSGMLERELIESGVARQRIARISNGIDSPGRNAADRAGIRAELGLASADWLVVQIGRLARSKRNDLLLEAVSRLPGGSRAHVAFVGDGQERVAIETLSEMCHLKGRVHFLGYRSDAQRFLSAADALVICSDSEGLPIVMLEAMAANCPIVATEVGAIGDVLVDEVSALLVPPNDVERLARAISATMENPMAALRRAECARAVFDTRHSRSAMGAQYLAVYNRMWSECRGMTA